MSTAMSQWFRVIEMMLLRYVPSTLHLSPADFSHIHSQIVPGPKPTDGENAPIGLGDVQTIPAVLDTGLHLGSASGSAAVQSNPGSPLSPANVSPIYSPTVSEAGTFDGLDPPPGWDWKDDFFYEKYGSDSFLENHDKLEVWDEEGEAVDKDGNINMRVNKD